MNLQPLARREFLIRALTVCGAPFLTQLTAAQTAQKPAPQSSPKRGTQVAAAYLGPGDLDAVKTIGAAYLRQLGVEPTEQSILAAAAGTLQLIAQSPTETAAVTALAQAVRRDFRQERSVQLEGWIMSRTEAELCTLALLPP